MRNQTIPSQERSEIWPEIRFFCVNQVTQSINRHTESSDKNFSLSVENLILGGGACIFCKRDLASVLKDSNNNFWYKSLSRVSSGNISVCMNCTQKISIFNSCSICSEKSKAKLLSPILTEPFQPNKLISFECGHEFSEKHFYSSIIEACTSRTILKENNGINCSQCEKRIDSEILKTQLGNDNYSQSIKILDLKKQNYSIYASISTEIYYSILCTDCNESFCNTCSKPNNFCSCSKQALDYCKVCAEPFDLKSTKTLDCHPFYCLSCLETYILFSILEDSTNTKQKNGISCFECKEIIGTETIKSLLNEESFEKYLKLFKNLIRCPRCDSVNSADKEHVNCINCHFEFCSSCLKSLQQCICGVKIRIEAEGLSSCPGCKVQYAKDEGCSNVKCDDEKCLTEFCFRCSAFKGPISAHGCQYHRPQCVFYQRYEGDDVKYQNSCFACVKAGKLCTPPADLRIRGLIDEDET